MEGVKYEIKHPITFPNNMATSAAPFVPKKPASLDALRRAAKTCKGCDLYKYAIQTVFGEGPPTARVALIGQQPGDQEDREGKPFVGPAGRLLDKALNDAGFKRADLYISNVVKHFKFKKQGKFRFHQKPSSREVEACRPWLKAEMELLRPELVVCLGVTAAEWILRRKVTLKRDRGQPLRSPDNQPLLVTAHPSSILRIPEPEERHAAYGGLVKDLIKAKRLLHV
jgi:uracil-DNA glycosylase